MKLRLFAILLLVVAGGAAVFVSIGGLPTSSAEASEYLTAAATVGDVSDEVAATGTIAASETWALGFGGLPVLVPAGGTATPGSGTWRVTSVKVAVGQAVGKGDVLAEASAADLANQLRSARTSLSAARIQEAAAKDALDAASGTDARRQARVGWYNAVNARRQAQQQVTDLRTQLAHATLTAPVDGTVTAVAAVAGLDSTGTAVTLQSTTYEVTADVVESDVAAMSVGQSARVSVGAIDAVIDGRVSSISPTASSSSGSSSVVSFPVTITLTGAPTALRAGMTADITIVSASATNVLMIPSAALRGTAGSYRVQVLGADGVPVARDVTVGLVTGTTAEIKSGLTAGDVVVTGTSSARAAATQSGNGRNGFGGGIAVPGGGPGTFVRP